MGIRFEGGWRECIQCVQKCNKIGLLYKYKTMIDRRTKIHMLGEIKTSDLETESRDA